jgi:hypothetical protein
MEDDAFLEVTATGASVCMEQSFKFKQEEMPEDLKKYKI